MMNGCLANGGSAVAEQSLFDFFGLFVAVRSLLSVERNWRARRARQI